MFQNMVHPRDYQLSIDEITSPLGAQLFEFCDSELFPETLQNSEVASTSNTNNCCYEEHASSQPPPTTSTGDMNQYTTAADIDSDQTNPPPPPPISGGGGNSTNSSTTPTITTTNDLSVIFDDENDISASIDFSTGSPPPSYSAPSHHHQYLSSNVHQEPFSIPSLNNHHQQISLGDHITMWPPGVVAPPPACSVVPMIGPPLPMPTTYHEDECGLPPSYMRMRSSQPPLMDPLLAQYLPSGGIGASFSGEGSGIFGGGGLMLGNDLSHHQELEFQGDSNGGIFLPHSHDHAMQRVFNCSTELQGLSSESGQLTVHGGTNTGPLGSEISSLDDPTFKVGKLSVEERKRKIHRYMKKRNERNFSKKIKYACRKTLADSRPRVRGRFAKNDELGEMARSGSNNHEDDTDEDVGLFSNSIPDHQRKGGVKDEEEMDSADIFAHISGVNSFKCNYPIQSWI